MSIKYATDIWNLNYKFLIMIYVHDGGYLRFGIPFTEVSAVQYSGQLVPLWTGRRFCQKTSGAYHFCELYILILFGESQIFKWCLKSKLQIPYNDIWTWWRLPWIWNTFYWSICSPFLSSASGIPHVPNAILVKIPTLMCRKVESRLRNNTVFLDMLDRKSRWKVIFTLNDHNDRVSSNMAR